jgi:hypothetical protein
MDQPTPASSSEFCWTVPISIDTTADSLLSGAPKSAPEDASIPRETIAEELRGTFLQAKLQRPLHLGVRNGSPAYRLVFSFSFSRSGSCPRIRMATITIKFDDSPADAAAAADNSDSDDGDEDILPPAILAYYPKIYEGPVFNATVERSAEASIAFSGHNVISTGTKFGKKVTLEEAGRLTVHGNASGRPEHRIVWVVRENDVSRKGIPNTFELPLIVMPQKGRRFSASLGLRASYGIRRGVLSKNIPVSGGSKKPIYFDPAVLEKMAKNRERSRFDQNIIVEEVGNLEDCDLRQYSFFQ